MITMKQWARRLRGAVGMGLTWAVVWAPAGVLIGMLVDPDNSMDEMWVAIGAYPGFMVGVLFSVVLGIAGRRHRFDELSIPRFAAWGALAGVIAGALPFVLGDPATELPQWVLGGVVTGSTTLLGAVSAAGSLAVARLTERSESLAAGTAAAEAGGRILRAGDVRQAERNGPSGIRTRARRIMSPLL